MKFSLSVQMERLDPAQDMAEVARNALELVRMADQGGFEIAWTPEHHTIEMTAAPNPFTILTHWGAHTKRIRLGTAVVVAPYWHPIRLAGEAALCDLLIDGRLEFGIARGAYQYEFDRLMEGMPQHEGVAYLKEITPAVKALWQGDYAHEGHYWNFPAATSVPKPLQTPHPPIWVAARDPGSFDWAFKIGADIMTTPLGRPNEEIQILADKFEEAVANNPQVPRPRHMMMRRACVYPSHEDSAVPLAAAVESGRRFANLFNNLGGVINGFPEPVDYEEVAGQPDNQPEVMLDRMVFGTPEQVVEKLRVYERAGVDQFCYNAMPAIPFDFARRSLEMFITDVMPHFEDTA
jgi:alkanesulfonate monooxygenase SsuD/methylene tetrahydromethanopterin reductase-like flavin-dependent oxidoreductase (luciferase family)